MAKRVVLIDCDDAVGKLWLELPETILKLKSVLAQLKDDGTSVALFSAGDRAQLEPILQTLDISAPFIVESGSAIFTPIDQNPFELPLGDREGTYFVRQLGCPYVQARAGLRVVANMISHPLKGFGDFTIPQLQRLIGLSEAAAHQAKAREFSEPFMTPRAVEPAVLQQAAEAVGFKVIWRTAEENRFSELVGADASLTAAVKILLGAYSSIDSSLARSLAVVGVSMNHSVLDELRIAAATEGEIAFWDKPPVSGSVDSWIAAIESTGSMS
ncbi:haloacid dehalogenase [cf. Phormidesmis sp. LEGE 11477]|uniref:haloacid dehalogenase n=1 Tax=cf. Phormidesmis sp. LEGE 11477 TaxID=1828680 RepID=UPI00187EF616|nr:haloacid dehalogenase [cf. Phormidesmis sp. LEGE 11477]MBE9062367.1 haloacid dehalogenase [cf. Phormidesmis sp. LEGE 11477]